MTCSFGSSRFVHPRRRTANPARAGTPKVRSASRREWSTWLRGPLPYGRGSDCRRSERAARIGLVIRFSTMMAPCAALAQVRVVTTTPNYEDLTRQIGGEHVSVESVMRGPESVHNVVHTPSHMMKLKKADLWVHSGLDAELWAPLLVKGARNPRLLPGQPGDVDVSRGIALKEVPSRGGLTRALGDIHIYGNVHFALDPLNGIVIARTITEALKRADPAHAEEFESRCQDITHRLRQLTERLVERMRPYRGTPVVTYHRSWPYFLDRFGLRSIGEIEPKPGIAPGPRHLSDCIESMKSQGARIVIVETFNRKKDADFVAERVGGRAVLLAHEVRALPEIDTYEKLFEYNVEMLFAALQETGVPAQGTAASPAPTTTSPPQTAVGESRD